MTLIGKKGAELEEKKVEEYVPPRRRLRTLAILLSSICWGLGISIPGLSLLALQRQVGVSLQQITIVVTARSIGHLCGAMLSGYCYDRFENNLVMGFALFGAGVVGNFVPLAVDYHFLLIAMVVWGIFTGYIDTGNNYLSLDLWGKKAGPVLQAGNMLVATGGLVMSLVAGPFLSVPESEPIPADETNFTIGLFPNEYDTILRASMELSNTSQILLGRNESLGVSEEYKSSLLYIPYLFLGIVYIAVSVLYLCLYCKLSGRVLLPRKERTDADAARFSQIDSTLCFRYTILLLFCVFIVVYVGIEAILVNFLFVFAMESGLNFSTQSASFLMSVFWGGFSLTRGVCVIVARFLHPRTMLIVDLTGCCASALVLLLWSESSVLALWIGAIMYSVSIASAWPAAVTWSERYIRVSGKIAALFLVTVSFCYLFYPWVVGILISKFSLMHMIYLLLTLSVGSLSMFVVLQTVASKCSGRGGTALQDDPSTSPDIIYSKEIFKTEGIITTV